MLNQSTRVWTSLKGGVLLNCRILFDRGNLRKAIKMSHIIKSFGSRSIKHHYKEYLSHKDEPREESLYGGALAEIDAGVLMTSIFEKRKFRRTAKRLRRYAT
jgi:hypothetical protein